MKRDWLLPRERRNARGKANGQAERKEDPMREEARPEGTIHESGQQKPAGK